MSLAIIDAREWQNTFDLRTGHEEKTDSQMIRMAKSILANHAYPGDTNPDSNAWVTDTALELVEKYQPQFIFLAYAQFYFSDRHEPLGNPQRGKMLEELFKQVDRFIGQSGFTPVIMGNGDTIPVLDTMELNRLDGLALSSGDRYAGLYRPSERDWEYINALKYIERIVPKQEFLQLFGGTDADLERLPDYILVASEGYTWRRGGRRVYRIPGNTFSVPMHTSLEMPADITDIRGIIEKNLSKTKIAFIMIEGVGPRDFPKPFELCNNSRGWFYYEPADMQQYLAINSGMHQVFLYPIGSRYWLEFHETKEYPFSGFFREMPQNTIADQFKGRSAAVGNRSMLMHTTISADISIECFARNLYNQGCMAVIHREKQ
jgi:hypothetical protein